MNFLNMFKRKTEDFAKYRGDSAFLSSAVSAVALVINADGKIESAEQEAALRTLGSHELLSTIYKESEIRETLNKALLDSQTRSGRLALSRNLEAATSRDITQREDIFMIAADVADVGDIGPEEKRVLENIGSTLHLDAAKLLAS